MGREPEVWTGHLRAGLMGLLAVLVFLVYAQTVSFDFVRTDDIPYVTQNPHVLEGPTGSNLAWAFTTMHRSNWHPLTWISLMVDARLGGGGPGMFHLTNVVLHLVNTWLLLLILVRLTGKPWRGFAVAMLFAVHPLHVESVAWVVERKDVLSSFCGFLSMLAWIAWTRRGKPWRYGLALGLFTLGLMAKPMLVTWPFVFLLLDLWPLSRLTKVGPLRLIAEKLPFFILSAAGAVITYLAQSAGGAVGSLDRYGLGLRWANAVTAYTGYILKMFNPTRLGLQYPYDFEPSVGWVAAAALFLVAASVAALAAVRRRPYLVVGWFWYLGMLVPVIGLVQVGRQSMADRYTYLPLVGLFVVVTWGAWELLVASIGSESVRRRVAAGLLAVTALASTALAHRQASYWKDSLSLYSRAIEVTGGSVMAHVNLGVELESRGRGAEAMEQFRRALALDPLSIEARVNLAASELKSGNAEQAVSLYREALMRLPRDAAIRIDLALALTHLGQIRMRESRLPEAGDALDAALEHDPTNALTHKIRGQVAVKRGRIEEGIASLERSLLLDPNQPLLNSDLARLRAIARE